MVSLALPASSSRKDAACSAEEERVDFNRYSHILKNIIPTLSRAGVSEGTIQTMTVENPKSYFGG